MDAKKNNIKKETYCYPIILTYEKGKEIAVEIPDLDVATSGEDDEDALLSARELLGITIYGLEEDGEEIPSPSPLNTFSLEKNQRASLVDVYMPSIRNAQNNRSINRTVTLPAWLNSIALEKNINFSQLLQEAIKRELKVG